MEAGELSGGEGKGEGAARWKRFTPPSVDMSRCLARIWSGGRGGQCANPPLPGEDLCKRHAAKFGKDGCHGKVTGEIPEKKLKEFEKEAEKAERDAFQERMANMMKESKAELSEALRSMEAGGWRRQEDN